MLSNAKLQLIVFISGIILSGLGTFGANAWSNEWFFVFVLLAWVSSCVIEVAYSKLIALGFFYALARCIFVFMNQDANKTLDPSIILSLDKLSAIVAMCIMFFLSASIIMSKKLLGKTLEQIFQVLCITNAFYVIFQKLCGLPTGGFFTNYSINGTFIAITYPLLVMSPEIESYGYGRNRPSEVLFDSMCIYVPIIALLVTDASVPVIGMAVAWFFHYLSQANELTFVKNNRQRIGLAIFALCLIIGIGIVTVPNFFHDSGRFVMWRVFWDKLIITWQDLLFGVGPGSFMILGPHAQVEAGVNLNMWFVWAHNDFLQVAIEFGLIGLGLLMVVIGEAAYRAFKCENKRYLGISLMTYCATALFNWPSRLPMLYLYAIFLLVRIYDTENKNDHASIG